MFRTACFILLLLSVTQVTTAFAFQPGNQSISIQVSPGPNTLVKSATVQRALELSEPEVQWVLEVANQSEQKSREILQTELQAIMATGRVQMETVQAKVAEVRADLAEKAYKDLGAKLTPKQIGILRSIELQMAGVQAFDRPTVKASLQITPDQMTDIELTMSEMKSGVAALRKELGISNVTSATPISSAGPGAPQVPTLPPMDRQKQDEFDSKQLQLNQKGLVEIRALLTEAQRVKLDAMFGPAFDTQAIRKEMKSASMIKPEAN